MPEFSLTTETLGQIIQVAGSLGLFLLGMIIMTQGLRELAGNAIRAALMRFASSPGSGALTGAISTAILQSSSATTVAVVGFVGAGLMSFDAALGIIFGANIGTTVTGWLVALLGFKLQLGKLLLPLVLCGAILRLFATGKPASAGFALAGFGLIFTGIDSLQTAMSGMQGLITPETLPAGDWPGRILIVLLGVLITIITQSSSAGVATTMTALYSGAISFEQGLALVIGMDVGTTFTALMASTGGSTAARRTGLSHVLYNLFTAAGALLLVTPYIAAWQHFLPGMLQRHAEIALVAFHSLFNLLGVLAILPFTAQFSRLVRRLVRERGTPYLPALDRGLLETPALALTALQDATLVQYVLLLNHVDAILGTGRDEQRANLARCQEALNETQEYLDALHFRDNPAPGQARMIALVHALDHLQRLHERCEEDEDRAMVARESEILFEMHNQLQQQVTDSLAAIAPGNWQAIVLSAAQADQSISQLGAKLRDLIATSVASDTVSIPDATGQLEAIRWLERVAHHLARINHHLYSASLASGK